HLVGEKTQIVLGLLGKLGIVAQPERRLLPSRERLVAGARALQHRALGREVREPSTRELVLHADRNLRQMIEDIELGDDQSAEIIQAGAVARRGHVEPAAAPGAARDRAVLAAALTESFALRSRAFGGKGPAADPRGLGLGDA